MFRLGRSAISLLVLSAVLSPLARASGSGSASFRNTSSSVDSGGARKTSTNYRGDSSQGAVSAPAAVSASFSGRDGFMAVAYRPARVTDLWVSSTSAATEIYLQWTAPGNDGGEDSAAGSFKIKYTSIAVNSPALSDANFTAAPAVAGAPAPGPRGTRHTMIIGSLQAGVTYFFAIETAERDGVRSALSGGATAQTLAPLGCAAVRNVDKANGPYTTIQSAVDSLPGTLSGNSCVIVRDGATYAEQVTVRNFTNNGSSITITADPASGLRPVVSPPALSTAAFLIANASVSIQGIGVSVEQPVPYGVWASSGYVTLSSVSVSASASLGVYAAGVRISSWSAISYSSVTVWDAHGFWLDGATATAVAFSTAVNDSATTYPVFVDGGTANAFTVVFASNSHASGYGLYALGSDMNTVTRSYLWGGARGAVLTTGADYNAVSLSTMIGSIGYGFQAIEADSNTVTSSFLWGDQRGAGLSAGADYNAISLSTMIGYSFYAFVANAAASNTVTQSYLWGGSRGAVLLAGSAFNTISLSTMIGGTGFGLYASASDSNTVAQSYLAGSLYGAWLDAGADFNTISLSTMISDSAGNAALYIRQASSNTVLNSYVQGSTAAFITGSTGTVLGGSVFIATSTIGSAIALAGGSVNLVIATSALHAPSLGRGLGLNPGNDGVVSLGSVTFSGSARGIEISTQGALFTLSADSITFRGLASGATAVHFLGGTFVTTITLANFEDSSAGVNVSAAALDTASRITMNAYYGARKGAAYENDPNSVVDWVSEQYEGCAAVRNVGSGQDYATISAAVASLPGTLTGHSCVVIRDGATYAEQVTVQGFANNGSSITILAAPGFAPVVSPPAASTAAFLIANASVNIQGISVVATQDIPYGVWASSSHVALSSVAVSTSGGLGIYEAGVRLSSWSAISYSTVAVWNAHGIWLEGSVMTSVSYSTASSEKINGHAVYLQGASSNTLTGLYARRRGEGAGYGVYLANNSNANTLSRSMFLADAPGFAAGLAFDTGSSSNTVVSVHAANPQSAAAGIANGADYNTVSQSTFSGGAAGSPTFVIAGGNFNVLTGLYSVNPTGQGIKFQNGANHNTLTLSTMVVSASGDNYALYVVNSASNTVTNSYIENRLGYAAVLEAAFYNSISLSTMVSDAPAYSGLYLLQSSSNSILNSHVQGSTAVFVSGSTGTVIAGAVLAATGATGSALELADGSVNLTIATSTLRALSLGRGLALSEGNAGLVTVGSVTFTGAGRGIEASTQSANFSLTADSITFRGLASGATAIHFLGGTFVSTFTLADFEDASVAVNVSAAALSTASRVTMAAPAGARQGSAYENDPNSLVDWPFVAAPGAPAVWFVGSSSAGVQYGLAGASGYTITASTAADFTGALVSSTVFGAQDRLAAAGLDANTTYYFRTGALWGATTSYAAAVLSTSTLSKLVSGTAVHRIHASSIVVNWLPLASAPPDASSNSAAGYVLEVSTRPDFIPLWTSSAAAGAALSTLTASGLQAGSTYYFRVGSRNWNGVAHYAGAVSTYMPVSVAAPTAGKLPQAPFGLSLSSAGAAVTLTWLGVQRFDDGAAFGDPAAATGLELSGYRVYRATSAAAGAWTQQVLLSSSAAAWTDAAGGAQYYYHVRAENSSGLSGRTVIRSAGSLSAFAVAPDDLSYLEVTSPGVSLIEGVGGQAMTAYLVEASSHPEDLGGRVVKSVEFTAKQGGLASTTNFELSAMARLKLRYELGASSVVAAGAAAAVPAAPGNLGVYWFNGSQWIQMYGRLDQTDQTLTLETKYVGRYQLRLVERVNAFSFDQAGVSNRFVTPNGDGKNDGVVFRYDNPRDVPVRARILDMRGRVVVSELPQGPIANSRIWDARAAGLFAPSGVYLYQIEAEGRVFSGSIVILK